jgi:L-iditol 2-dehydrogenase
MTDTLTATMRAGFLTAPGTIAMIDAPAPDPQHLAEGEVLLRVLAGGICGSDLPAFRGTGPVTGHPAPIPGGSLHEVVGEVLASRHPQTPVGARVVGWAARFDGLAELVVTPGSDVRDYDAALPPTTAVLLQPLACVLDALVFAPDPRGARVAVLGLGPIGLLFTHALKAAGAAHVTGVDLVDRSAEAALFGIDEPVRTNAAAWAGSLAGERPALVIEAVGHQVGTLAAAVRAMGVGGHVHAFGVPDDPVYPLPMGEFFRKAGTLSAAAVLRRRDALALASAYLAEHPDLADNYVTDVVPFERAQQAFETAALPAPGRAKVVLDLG